MTGGSADLVIRPLTPDDQNEEFGRIVLESYLALPGMPRDSEYEAELADVASRVRNGIVLGAFHDEKPVGCVTFVPGPSDSYAEKQLDGEAGFRMLAVDAKAQSRGIGEALVRACIGEAKKGRGIGDLHILRRLDEGRPSTLYPVGLRSAARTRLDGR